MRFLLPLLMLASSDLPPPLRVKGCSDTLGGGQFKTANWEARGLVAAAPILTEGYESGPTGSCFRATRVQTTAATGAQFSAVFNDNGVTATDFCPQTGGNNISYGCWVKAASAVTVDFCAYDTGHAWRCAARNITTSFAWHEVESVSWADCTTADCQFLIGGAPIVNGGTARGALDFSISNCRCIEGDLISP